MENQNTQNLAEKLARLLQNEITNSDFAMLQSNLKQIDQRLERIETQISFQNPKSEISNPKPLHSSQEKFANLEELADEIINGFQTEKACPYEPTGKPCDHCAMCSSRGF